MSEVTLDKRNVLVQDILGKKRAGDLGLEIEVESVDGNFPQCTEPWLIKTDTSLRNFGAEYYTKNPILCNSKKIDKIRMLTDALNKTSGIIRNCPRTSVHVHLNILRHTPLQVWTAVATYWLMDNLLVKYCGAEEREGNIFCLRAKDAEAVVQRCIRDIRHNIPFGTLTGDQIRYSSQNLNAIRQFGSLEYRCMRGTLDASIIDVWSTELYNIVHKSKRFFDPANMLETFLSIGADKFMRLVLSDSFVDGLHGYGNPDSLMNENVGLLIEMCYIHDWAKWEERVNKDFPSKKVSTEYDIDDWAIQ